MGKRETTKKTIIDAASSVLLGNGLAETSMEMVSDAAGIHRRTVYRYFPLREDLLFEVVISMLEDMNSFQRNLQAELAGSGIERFSGFLYGLIDYMENNRAKVRFMGEFDFYFNEMREYMPSGELAARFAETAHVTEDIIAGIIRDGTSDGSIQLPEDPEVFVPTVTTVLWGTAQRVALRGSRISEEFGVSGIDMVRCQIRLYVDAISTGDVREKGSK